MTTTDHTGPQLDRRIARLERQNRWLRGGLLIAAGALVGGALVGFAQPQQEKAPVVGVAIHAEDDLIYVLREDGLLERSTLQQRSPGPRNRLNWQIVGQ